MDFTVNLWDIRRPFVPMAAWEDQRDATTGIVWRDENAIIAACKDGSIYMHKVDLSTRPSDRAHSTSLGLHHSGGIIYTRKMTREEVDEDGGEYLASAVDSVSYDWAKHKVNDITEYHFT